MTARLRVLVVTVAHRGDDARISHRQIGALSDAGAEVTYIAPEPRDAGGPVTERVVVRRAVGRRRLRAWYDATRAVRRRRGWADIVLVHDLEAVLPVRLGRPGCPIVWDVHEDLAASVVDRSYVPLRLRPAVRWAVLLAERGARRGCRLILAEDAYADRFGAWPVVPNTTIVPDRTVPYRPEPMPRVVYVGRISRSRGLPAMLELGRRLGGDALVELVGPADADVREELEAAVRAGSVRWLGPMANEAALAVVDGALVGLCLLDPLPNYVVSMPTKIYEYAARGVPAVVSPLPLAVEAIARSGGGLVVDPRDPSQIEAAVRRYLDEPGLRDTAGAAGVAWMREHHDWRRDGQEFAAVLSRWAFAGDRRG